MRALANYEQNITSVLAQFPAAQINKELLSYLSSVDAREKDIAELTVQPIREVRSYA